MGKNFLYKVKISRFEIKNNYFQYNKELKIKFYNYFHKENKSMRVFFNLNNQAKYYFLSISSKLANCFKFQNFLNSYAMCRN